MLVPQQQWNLEATVWFIMEIAGAKLGINGYDNANLSFYPVLFCLNISVYISLFCYDELPSILYILLHSHSHD